MESDRGLSVPLRVTAKLPSRFLDVLCRVFDDSYHSGSYEPCRTNGCPRPCYFRNLDRPADVGYFDPPTGPGRLDLKPLDTCSDVDEDLYAVTSHRYQGSFRAHMQEVSIGASMVADRHASATME